MLEPEALVYKYCIVYFLPVYRKFLRLKQCVCVLMVFVSCLAIINNAYNTWKIFNLFFFVLILFFHIKNCLLPPLNTSNDS